MNGYIPTPQDDRLKVAPRATITSTTPSGVHDMGRGFAPGGPGLAAAAVVQTSAAKTSAGNETYSIRLQESDDGTNNWADCSLPVPVTSPGAVAAVGFVNKRYVRVQRTLGGTSPSLDSEAWLNFNVL